MPSLNACSVLEFPNASLLSPIVLSASLPFDTINTIKIYTAALLSFITTRDPWEGGNKQRKDKAVTMNQHILIPAEP